MELQSQKQNLNSIKQVNAKLHNKLAELERVKNGKSFDIGYDLQVDRGAKKYKPANNLLGDISTYHLKKKADLTLPWEADLDDPAYGPTRASNHYRSEMDRILGRGTVSVVPTPPKHAALPTQTLSKND